MRFFLASIIFLIYTIAGHSQSISNRLAAAYQKFEADSQLNHASVSLYIIDANTGEVVFDKNSRVGLAPASTQKIITSVSAFELLGADYSYQTMFFLKGKKSGTSFKGNLVVDGSGDPTLGSWRYISTKEEKVLAGIMKGISRENIKSISGEILISQNSGNGERIPDGWIWQDIGNYYGAGASAFNWRENQFDIVLASGSSIGDPVKIVKTVPRMVESSFRSEVRSAAKGTGDNAYIYLASAEGPRIIRGTIPINESAFTISGAMTDPGRQLSLAIQDNLSKDIKFNGDNKRQIQGNDEANILIYQHQSPSLDSIVYWFNKRSINLYGEALVKTIAFQKKNISSTDTGLNIIRKFWRERGLNEEQLNMYDGSGLSPLNRVTTFAQVFILKYARSRPWYKSFYDALPDFNNMRMKSGTISDVKGFCGYHRSREGHEFIFSFLVNNYNGRASQLVNKMYKVLDELK